MRWVAGVLVGGLAVLALAACGGTHQHPRARTATSRAPARRIARPAPPKTPPALAQLQRTLGHLLHAAGAGSGALVDDLSSGRTLFSLRAAVARPPASVEKLYTSVAVLADLGPTAELQTAILATGHVGPGGVWHGNLYLRGGGDPSLGDGTFNQIWEGGYGPTAEELIAPLRRLGIRRVTGRVIGDASLFDSRAGGPATGYAADIPDLGGQLSALAYDHGGSTRRLGPGAFAARELVLTLRRAHIRARAATLTAPTPAGARPLASVSSPPMSILLRLTDVPSDDFFAEMLTKQLGVRIGGSGTTAAGAAAIAAALGRFGLTPKIVDGSGLSREDRSSPLQVVDLLRAVWDTTTGRLLVAALPVVGVSGTVQRLGQRTAAAGRCQAKTGTLNYVTNLAGYCQARGHHALAFALFLDGPSNHRGMTLLGQMVAAIARY